MKRSEIRENPRRVDKGAYARRADRGHDRDQANEDNEQAWERLLVSNFDQTQCKDQAADRSAGDVGWEGS
jgi:hypothetical protein